MKLSDVITYASVMFWTVQLTCKAVKCKHINIVLVNTSISDLSLESKSYTQVPDIVKDSLVKQLSCREVGGFGTWKACIGSTHMICDPQNIFSTNNKRVIEETIVGICSSSTCQCSKGCSHRQYCKGIQTRVIALQLGRNNTLGPTGDLVQAWQNSGRCPNDLYISLLIPYNRTQKPDQDVHIFDNEDVAAKCKDHVIRKTQKMIDQRDYGMAMIYQIQLYRHILLGEYSCNEIASVLITMDTLIGLIYLCVCIPVMGCVTMVFLSSGMRGNSGKSGSKSLTGYRRECESDWSQESRKSSRL